VPVLPAQPVLVQRGLARRVLAQLQRVPAQLRRVRVLRARVRRAPTLCRRVSPGRRCA
jgi:hypothetical protein